MRISSLAYAFVAFASAAAAQQSGAQAAPAAATTIIIVRHAEKAAAPAADPPLTPLGVARAETLRQLVRDAGVRAVISTQFVRTRTTGAPAAAALGITPEVLDARLTPGATRDSILARHRGQTVLLVGHSNTLPALVEAFGVPRPADICDAGYDNVFVVTVPSSGSASVLHLHFGTPTPCGESAPMMKP
ncbi:MAG: histidine phosphatase family protein [Gemmatimonadota bacterium]|nr:histidine phosphatase family protein [Gemmatimonadota bacterium]